MKKNCASLLAILAFPQFSFAEPIGASPLKIEVPVAMATYMVAQYIPGPAHSSTTLSIGDVLGTLQVSTSVSTPIQKITITQPGNRSNYYLKNPTSPNKKLLFTIGATPSLNHLLTGLVTSANVSSVSELDLPLKVAQNMTAPPGVYKGTFVISIYGD